MISELKDACSDNCATEDPSDVKVTTETARIYIFLCKILYARYICGLFTCDSHIQCSQKTYQSWRWNELSSSWSSHGSSLFSPSIVVYSARPTQNLITANLQRCFDKITSQENFKIVYSDFHQFYKTLQTMLYRKEGTVYVANK